MNYFDRSKVKKEIAIDIDYVSNRIGTIMSNWTKQSVWQGNPSLGLESWVTKFMNPHTGKLVPVYVFGKPDSTELIYCVDAGANSDYSYSGCFYPEQLSFSEFMARVDLLYKQGKLFR